MQIELTRPEMCEEAARVVVAEVTGSEARWSQAPDGGIETVVWLAVRQDVKGQGMDTVELSLLGGAIGELWQWVEDQPRLEPDRTYLLFLDAQGRVLGGDQGAVAVRIEGDPGGGEPLKHALASLGSCHAP
jgi:hypothetical protein